MNPKLSIEIWSDIVCPFCYIGKMKLEQALRNLNALDRVEITWRSFQLDPQFPKHTSMSSAEHLSSKTGILADRLYNMFEELKRTGKRYGIDLNVDKTPVFNTYDIHRLWQWSKTLNKGTDFKNEFLYQYFTNCVDFSKQDKILDSIEKIGLDKARALEILNSDEFVQAFNFDMERGSKFGVRGVPHFVFNQKKSFVGAQEDELFEEMIEAELNKLAI
jgi:predicted DsbA family dithiol-disulfide isomerase